MDSNTLPPTTLVIFGITGDLSRRKLLPALAEIRQAGQLPNEFKVLGVTRRDVNKDEILASQEQLKDLVDIFQMDLELKGEYLRLKTQLEQIDPNRQVIFYLAVPPESVQQIIGLLGDAGLNGTNHKLLLEKPFGTNLESAKRLIGETAKHFNEDQIYRIDHYLAKEMAQNIVVFLGANVLFQDVWNKDFIEKIQVVLTEEIGIEGRDTFYEQTGSLRDMVQSHLLQLTALVLMEPCSDIFNFEEIPAKRLVALRSLEPANPQNALRAQYQGYKDEVGNLNSKTETFCNVRLYSRDNRWEGVPVELTTGKALNQKLTEVRVYFKKSHASQTNMLYLRIQPNEAVELDLWVKEPGYEHKLQKKPLNFEYGQHFDKLPEAYEQVLIDAFRSNHSLFASGDEVIASWEILQPVLDNWQQIGQDIKTYKSGSSIEEVLNS